MSDRISSDNDAVETVRATLERVGRTDRPQITLPDDADVPTDEVVRLSISGTEYHAHIEASLDGTPVIRGAFDNARLARTPDEGAERLAEWVESDGIEFGGSVLFDVVTAGFKYGVRSPGERVIYDATDAPDDSLAAIADQLESDE
ncbi:hypothetical protein VB773_06890 [Haloarculaceae archaeon H-GB2-1]|nr:hypothetical protein [Haloarculaceae archaeon H-GB1-1]MEA5385819.1 hypothetical protein [Haloarculaceae archaeon H-GB11]MEA5407319.1 hypothetical protein [Haloarculaceae archaeon H-GB2-1]